MSKKKKGNKNAPAPAAAAAAPASNPHSTAGEQSDWGAKLDTPWKEPAREPPAEGEGGGKRSGKGKGAAAQAPTTPTPSVMGFLAKVGTPASGNSPARGLLGKVTAEDLKAVGRLPSNGNGNGNGNGNDDAPVATVQVALDPPPKVDPGTPEDRLARLRALNREEGGRDKRRSDRFPFSVRVEYSTVGRTRSEMAENLSATGMFIHTTQPLEIGDPVMVHFAVPDSNMPLSLPARVKWVSAFGELDRPSSGMGLEFTALDEKKKRNLATVIARLRSARP